MKKAIALISCFVFLVGLPSCGGGKNTRGNDSGDFSLDEKYDRKGSTTGRAEGVAAIFDNDRALAERLERALTVDFESVDDTPIPDEQVEQFWACGSGKDWNPSADGKRLDSPSNKSGIVKSSNLGMLIESLIGAGLAEDVLEIEPRRVALALLHALETLPHRSFELAAVHVNHHLRGAVDLGAKA